MGNLESDEGLHETRSCLTFKWAGYGGLVRDCAVACGQKEGREED